MRKTSKSFRLHIGLFGRRNTGKSSLLNATVRQQVSIVSDVAGTTTDPVEKPMEMLPLGPVLFIDTAGVDDIGALGEARVDKTRQIFDRTDVALLVVGEGSWSDFEERILGELADREIPVIVVFNKSDLASGSDELKARLKDSGVCWIETVATRSEGVPDLREALIRVAPDDFVNTPPIITDLVQPGEMVVLVVPIDKEAPKGRLIQPQVQVLRELLDADCSSLVVQAHGLQDTLKRLKGDPALVVTDSQAFQKVAEDTPQNVKMTSFSILFARQKGDLGQFVRGAKAIDDLRPGDRVLIAESCSHHPIAEDIGRVQIPRFLRRHVGDDLEITVTQGHDFPDDLSEYQLVVHCGACMWNRREMLSRLLRCRQAEVPICNYGMAIAHALSIIDRALVPFEGHGYQP